MEGANGAVTVSNVAGVAPHGAYLAAPCGRVGWPSEPFRPARSDTVHSPVLGEGAPNEHDPYS